MAINNRVYYACQAVAINGPSGQDSLVENPDFDTVHGLQSVGINTNFNLDPVYQLGQLDLYDNYEDIPDVEVTLNKVLDGQPTIYGMAMGTGTLTSLANHKCGIRLTIHPDTDVSATGAPIASCEIMPAYLQNITYSFPSEGNFTEEVTLIANSKRWLNATELGAIGTAHQPAQDNPNLGAGIARRQMLRLDSTTVLPTGLSVDPETATTAGSGGIPHVSRIQNVTVSMELGREAIYSLGNRIPYTRFVNFPVEVTCEIEVIAATGDMVNASELNTTCANPKGLMDKQIKFTLCDGMMIDLGSKNKLQSVNYTGGDTGGGNATATYSYLTYSHFTYRVPDDTNNYSTVGDGAVTYSDVVEGDVDFPLS